LGILSGAFITCENIFYITVEGSIPICSPRELSLFGVHVCFGLLILAVEEKYCYKLGFGRLVVIFLVNSEYAPFKREMDQVRAEEEEAIIFLAKIIPKKDKKWIRREIESIGRSDCTRAHG